MEIKEKKTKSIAHNISLHSQGLPQTSFFKKNYHMEYGSNIFLLNGMEFKLTALIAEKDKV